MYIFLTGYYNLAKRMSRSTLEVVEVSLVGKQMKVYLTVFIVVFV